VREKHKRTRQLKADLARGIRNVRRLQADIQKLRVAGVKEAQISQVMIACGFAGVTPTEMMAAKSVEDIARLVIRLRRPRLN